MRNAGLARDRKAPELRPSDETSLSSKRQRLDHIGATPHTAIDQDGNAPADRFDDRRERRDGGRRAVELAPAMIGNDDAIDPVVDRGLGLCRMKNALEQQRSLPDTPELAHILP